MQFLSFCDFFRSDVSLAEYRNRYFLFSSLAVKNAEVVIVPCCLWKYVLTTIFIGTVIPGSPNFSFVVADEILSNGHKNYFEDRSFIQLQCALLILHFFTWQNSSWKVYIYISDKFELHYSLNSNFTNFQVVILVLLAVNFSLNQILLLCLRWTWRLNLLLQIPCCFSLIQKDYATHIHSSVL